MRDMDYFTKVQEVNDSLKRELDEGIDDSHIIHSFPKRKELVIIIRNKS